MTQDTALTEPGIVTKFSPRSVADTVSRLIDLITAKGMKLFAVIDQSAEAKQARLQLRDTMLDMPLKVLIWDDAGQTKITYYATATLAARHHLSADLAAKLAGIDPFTDTVITP